MFSVWWRFAAKEFTGRIDLYTESDWAGEPTWRKSTSGEVLRYEGCVIKMRANLQGTVALSSPEAKFLATIKGAQEALELRTTLLEMGIETHIFVHTASSAAQASVEQPGLMHMEHAVVRAVFDADRAARLGVGCENWYAGQPSGHAHEKGHQEVVDKFWNSLGER